MRRRLPLSFVVLGAIGAAFVALPVLGLALRAPWGRMVEILTGPGARTALRLSLEVSLLATLCSVVFGVPLVVLSAEAGFRSIDPRFERAAAVLGAKPGYTLRRVILPMVAPQLVAGAVLAWARALGEFGATITFAGNLQGRTQTVPLAVFQRLQTDREGAIALSLVLVAVSICVLVALRDRITGTG